MPLSVTVITLTSEEVQIPPSVSLFNISDNVAHIDVLPEIFGEAVEITSMGCVNMA